MTSWSEPRITTLRTLWLDGLSASQIAKQLGGVTRNAVIGKVHRLGLGGRGAPSAPGCRTSVGAIDERGRLPGETRLASSVPSSSRGSAEKSVNSLLSRNPSTMW